MFRISFLLTSLARAHIFGDMERVATRLRQAGEYYANREAREAYLLHCINNTQLRASSVPARVPMARCVHRTNDQ